ncbi:Kelch repeat protein [Madurella fahalii]|uniref:Kelch repeat protein n=1 Tax=Madurella fahalii TaxID=1157608 RepID=A0ABQ0G8K3_9PEZI
MATSPVVPRQGNGPVNASLFLRRAYHSSAVLNRWLYIDGGEFSYLNGSAISYQYLDSLIAIDLANNWSNSSVTLHEITKPSGAPSLRNGGVWVHRATGRLYIGFAGTNSQFGGGYSFPQGLWSFTSDQARAGSWENLNGSTHDSFTNQPRPFRGQVASGDGFGFFLGGSVHDSDSTQPNLSGFTVYDFSSGQLTNSADAQVPAPERQQYSGMTFVPNWGSRGILVSVGGYQDNNTRANGTAPFKIARVYDVHHQRWFEQETSGDLPQPRKEFCIAGAQSNNRTHDILVYAGWNGRAGPDAIPYDSAFVLTLPGFHWVRADYPSEHPRHGHSCNAVGGGQIVAVGGVDTAYQGRETYIGVFDTADTFTQGLAIFDLSKLAWSPSYSAGRGLQTPAPRIQEYYNAKGRAPASGFSSRDLEQLFSVDDFGDSDESTSISGASYRRHSDVGAVVGSLVGVAAALAVAGVVAYCAHRRRVRRARARRYDSRARDNAASGLRKELSGVRDLHERRANS